MKPTVSPRRTPSAASPAARLRTASAYSAKLASYSVSFSRSAGVSAHSAAVIWNASHIVAAESAFGPVLGAGLTVTSMVPDRGGSRKLRSVYPSIE